MSRSDYVYVVSQDDKPVATFTVKYECADWLYVKTQGGNYTAARFRDNDWHGNHPPAALSVTELRHQGYLYRLGQWQRCRPESRGDEPQPPVA